MLDEQNWTCPICLGELTVKNAHVDHDHVTGTVRGILCFNCNGGLGQFRDTAESLRRAALYLTAAGTATEPQGSPSSFDMAFATVLLRSDYAHAS